MSHIAFLQFSDRTVTGINHAPVVTAADISASRGQVLAASSLFQASDADGDSLLYFFYDNSADPASGHFTVNGVSGRPTGGQQVALPDDVTHLFLGLMFVNPLIASTRPQEFHVNVPANHAPVVTATTFRRRRGRFSLRRRCSRRAMRRRQPAVFLLRQQR